MNIKALITTLVLGSSSMASADSFAVSGSVHLSLGNTRPTARPVVVTDDCNTTPAYQPRPSRPVIQPAVWHAPVYHPENTTVGARSSTYVGRLFLAPRYASNNWYDLTEATRIDSNREFFNILGAGSFRAIKLQALGNGRSNIKQVAIEFSDATGRARTQVVRFDTWISQRSNPTLTIDLEGGYRQINRIIVYGSTDIGSAYKLMAL